LSKAAKTAALFCLIYATPVSALICSTDSNLAIADGSGSATPGATASINIVVPSSPGTTVTDLDFQVRINHTYVGDLIVTLTSPAGTTITLIDRPGVPATTFGCSFNNLDLTLDDAAGTSVETQCNTSTPAINGTHQPTGSLAAFNGQLVSGTWVLSVTDNAGQDTGTIISANNCLDVSTTPVTISSFESKQRGKYLRSKWQTSSESFNLGFHLWGNVDGEWQQLNKRLIASEVIDSVVPQDYKRRFDVTKLDGELSQVGISSVSASGQEEFYGPFEIGERYGEQAVPEYVDWTYERSIYDQAMSNAGYLKLKNRWVKNTPKRERRAQRQQERFGDVILEIESPAIYKISYQQLLDQGIDLNRFPIHKLALTRGGIAIPRRVSTARDASKRRFGAGSTIVFYAYGPSSTDARYVATQAYRLSLDPAKVVELHKVGEPQEITQTAESEPFGESQVNHVYTQSFGDKRIYSFGLEGDGWYDSSIRAIRSIGTKTINLNVAPDAVLSELASIELSMFGVTKFPPVDADGDGEVEPGHHYKVYLNRAEHPEAVVEGYADGKVFITVSQDVLGQLKHGNNEIQIELIPDNGHNLDLVYLLGGALKYQRPNVIANGPLNVIERSGASSISIQTEGAEVSSVYALDDEHNIVSKAFSVNGGRLKVAVNSNSSQRGLAKLMVVSDDAYSQPAAIYSASSTEPSELDLSKTDYVIIADASLRGDTLQRFVTRQNELGRRAKVISSQTIYDAYSSGSALPQAIADYLADQADSSAYRYVLLVGGHTYNYRAYNTDQTKAPINLIPSFYRATEGITKQIPTAVPFVDFDNDGSPDRAIGRWPVRDLDQLKLVVDKTLAWHADGSHKDSKTALFIADAKDQQNNFSQSTHRLMSSLGLELDPWQQLNPVLLDDILADNSISSGEKLNYTRDSIVDGVNQGPALTVYSGHGAPGVWGRQALVYGDVSKRFDNVSAPTLMVPLACYTTYYETPNVKSLPEVLLTDTAGGAVAITGAALLSRSGDNERFGRDLLEKMSVSGLDLGTAVLQIKQEIHRISPRHQTVVYNWVTLGDPTLSFGLPALEVAPLVDTPKNEH
jgi:subtilisin-like proprotein convertase family protein